MADLFAAIPSAPPVSYDCWLALPYKRDASKPVDEPIHSHYALWHDVPVSRAFGVVSCGLVLGRHTLGACSSSWATAGCGSRSSVHNRIRRYQVRFKKGDVLTAKYHPSRKPLCRVTKVTREGVVHCVNLVACATMKEGDEFCFTPDENTRYELHSKK